VARRKEGDGDVFEALIFVDMATEKSKEIK